MFFFKKGTFWKYSTYWKIKALVPVYVAIFVEIGAKKTQVWKKRVNTKLAKKKEYKISFYSFLEQDSQKIFQKYLEKIYPMMKYTVWEKGVITYTLDI